MDDKKTGKGYSPEFDIEDPLKANQEIEQEAGNTSDQFNDSEMGDAIAICVDTSFAMVTATTTQSNTLTQLIDNCQLVALNINADLAD